MRIEKISDLEYKLEYTQNEVNSLHGARLDSLFIKDVKTIMNSSEARNVISSMGLRDNSPSAIFDESTKTLRLTIARPEEDDMCLLEYLRGIYLLKNIKMDDDSYSYIASTFSTILDDRSMLIDCFAQKEIGRQKYGLYLANCVYNVELDTVDLLEELSDEGIKECDEVKQVFLNHMAILAFYIYKNTYALAKNAPFKFVTCEAKDSSAISEAEVTSNKILYTSNIDDLLAAAKIIDNSALVFKDEGYWILGNFEGKRISETNLEEIYDTEYETKLAYFTEHEVKCIGTLNYLSKI